MKKSQLRSSLLAVSALSVSIASQLHAVDTYKSNGTGGGDWNDPSSWLVGGLPTLLFPDTWLGDTAIISDDGALTGDLIQYFGGVTTPATPFSGPGSLAVAKGGKITIENNGTLEQLAGTTSEIRIGDGGAGAGTGIGELNIDTGGTFKTRDALGLLIGSDLTNPQVPNSGNGVGTVNIKDGVLLMGAGAALGGVGVGVEGSTGFLNIGDGAGLAETATLDLRSNNVRMGVGTTNQTPGAPKAGTGTVTVKLDGVIKQGSAGLFVGNSGGTGTLDILAGGKLLGVGTPAQADPTDTALPPWVAGGDLSVGADAGSIGTFSSAGVVTGVGRLIVGDNGALGVGPTPGGKVTISGGSFNAQETLVGRNGGVGVLDVTGGIVTTGVDHRYPNADDSRGFRIGTGGTNSLGTVSISGGEIHQAGWLDLGRGATNKGVLNISGTGKFFHEGTPNAATAANPGDFNNDSQVGRDGGTGEINVTDAGQFQTNFWINIARGGGATGKVTVDGVGGLGAGITMTGGQLNVGEDGMGTMNLKNGGKYTYSGGDSDATVGRNDGSNGDLTIESGGIYNGLTNPAEGDPGARHGQRLYVGAFGGTAKGTLNMTNGTLSLLSFTPGNSGKATINHTGGTINVGQWTEIGQDRNADVAGVNDAVYNLSGSGTLNTQQLFVGSRRKGTLEMTSGIINVGDDGTVSNNGWGGFSVGAFGSADGPGSHGEGYLNQKGGTINSIRGLEVGNQAGSQGFYTMEGASTVLNVNNGETHVGEAGLGVMTVKDGAQAHLNGGWSAKIGDQSGSNGTLNVSTGGQVTGNSWIVVGSVAGSTGRINIDDAASAITLGGDGRLIVAREGSGTVHQTAGTVTMHGWGGIGMDNGTGIYDLLGGELKGTTNDDFFIGRRNDGGTGTMTISNNAKFTGSLNPANPDVGARQGTYVVVGDEKGSHGTLILNDNALLDVRQLTVGNNGEGKVTQNGGTVQIAQWLKIAQGDAIDDATNVASYTLNAGIINTPELMVGEGRKGSMTVNGGTVNILNGSFAVGRWGTGWNGNNAVHANGTLTQTSGLITVPVGQNLDAPVGHTINAIGTLNVSGDGHFDMLSNEANPDVGARNGARLILGNEPGSQGTFTVADTALVEVRHLTVGQNGKATVTQTGGTVNVGQWLKIGEGNNADDAGNPALYTLTNGFVNTPELMIGEGRKGTMVVNGGEVNILNGGFGIGRWGPAFGAGNHGDGTLTQTAGTINSNGQLFLADQAGSKGLYELSGGTLNLGVGGNHNLLVGNTGNGTLNLTGSGTINGINDFLVARNGGSKGLVNIAKTNSADVLTTNAWFYVGGGTGSVGDVNVLNGELKISGQSRIGYNNGGGGKGTLTVTGAGAKFTGNDETFVGYESTTANGTIKNDGGIVNINHWLNVGRNGGTGTVTQTSGTFTVRDEARFGVSFNAEAPAFGTLELSGGTFTSGNTTVFGQVAGSLGTLNLSGTGAMTVNGELMIGNGLGNGLANITGGTILAQSWVGIGRDGGTGIVNLIGGTITKGNTGPNNPGTFDIGVFGNGATPGTGTLLQSGTGMVINTVTDTNIARDGSGVGTWEISGGSATLARLNVGNGGNGTLKMTGGSISAADRVSVGTNGGATGTANLEGGVLATRWLEAGGGAATLKLAGGTLQALQDQPDFIRGFTNSGGHSAIQLEGPGGTINSAGFRVKIAAGGSVFSSLSDTNSTDGLLGAVLSIKGGTAGLQDTDKVTLQTQVGDGVNHYLSVHVLDGGWLDDEVGQVLDNLTIDSGGYYELSALNSPPGAPEPVEQGAFDGGVGASALPASPVQGVPEPGSISLLLLSALGMLGRRNRGRKD